MVSEARNRTPAVDFRVEDMTSLSANDASLAGAVLFYSIVHFRQDELVSLFRELRRVLADGGLVLIAFHSGEEIVHRDELFGAAVSLDFRCHAPEGVAEALRTSRLAVIEQVLREPYAQVEYPSRRCYLFARAS